MRKLNLKQMAQNTLSEVELGKLQGGLCTCGCGCMYASFGGSSINANGNANRSGGLFSRINVRAYCDGIWYEDTENDFC